VEKPSSDAVHKSLINAGVCVLEREVLDIIPKGREVSIEREVFPELLDMGKPRAYVSSAYWRDIGTPRSYLAAYHDVLSGAIGRSGSEFLYMDVFHPTGMSKDATLLPPFFIAEGCQVEAGVTLEGRTSLGKGCLIEQGALVEGSVLFKGVRVGKGAIVRNSIVGPGAEVCGDSVCAVCRCSARGAWWRKRTSWTKECG
jgi:mannose-1-phosphate guanylyltransferase